MADLIQTKLYASVLGWKMPQSIAGLFPAVIQADKGVLQFKPRDELDLKLPVPVGFGQTKLKVSEGGLLTIFEALGAKPPNGGKIGT